MSGAAIAATATANLTPTATVTATCLINGNPLNFGAYNPLTGAPVLGATTISVQCTNGMEAPPVTMDEGQNPSVGSTPSAPLRQMSNGTGGLLTYNVYSDPGRFNVWGSTGVTSPTPDGTMQPMFVYGRINPGQTAAAAGTYFDQVIVTVTF